MHPYYDYAHHHPDNMRDPDGLYRCPSCGSTAWRVWWRTDTRACCAVTDAGADLDDGTLRYGDAGPNETLVCQGCDAVLDLDDNGDPGAEAEAIADAWDNARQSITAATEAENELRAWGVLS